MNGSDIWCTIQGIATNTMTLSATLWMNIICVFAVIAALFPNHSTLNKGSVNHFPLKVALIIVFISAIVSFLPFFGPGFVVEDGTCWISM